MYIILLHVSGSIPSIAPQPMVQRTVEILTALTAADCYGVFLSLSDHGRVDDPGMVWTARYA